MITQAVGSSERWTPLDDLLDLPPEEPRVPAAAPEAQAERARRIALDPQAPLLLGRYLVQGPLGEGPGAVVCSAVDVQTGRAVVVKLFRPSVAAAPGFEDWFERRAARAYRLRHPHLATVLDAGFGEYGPFVVAEPSGFGSLRALLRREGRLAPARVVRIARQVAMALCYLHDRELAHGALTAENVIVDAAGEHATLVDALLSWPRPRSSAPPAGAKPRGTRGRGPARRRPDVAADSPAADLDALGALLYELLLGQPPAGAAVGTTPSPRLFEPSIPAELDALVVRALDPRPERRWPSAEALEAALGELDERGLEPLDVRRIPPLLLEPSFEPRWPTENGRVGRAGRRGLVTPLVGVAAALALSLALFHPLVGSVPHAAALVAGPSQAAVPDLTGLPLQEARARAAAAGFTLGLYGSRASESAPRGSVLQQAPVAGFQADAGESIRVTLSDGAEVPDVRGLRLLPAQWELQDRGWSIASVERRAQAGAPSGTILQQDPAPGEVVDRAGGLSLVVAE